ncbi:aminoglycoside N(3)-acetyltransferase [Paenibacillus sacheonensis]|uniref:Aminoglycoside N(3)-acetyltransferase n=1 Tax=Paenibacillus sacheonensis TaxID=742054 RepID=A0A7X5C1A3_9BACL|nr:AAC(3) family N-acetyltransferase [Paenibacillus sacheonensis]MBM7568626.1 aminoglycoside 3-N-acetyltransferase [Paenibacillus sacheonensis]NBC72481.1 aminoglycoside N(3)-acetyltransferase [Paenibacillus sacheonensis]
MREHEIVANTRMPVTVSSLLRDLSALGVREGDCVLVHSSLSSLGWVCGGPQAVVQALLGAVGEAGTIVMPAQSGDWSDPAEWSNPPVPKEWIDIIYREMPAFDPLVTPTRGMGRIAETFRTYPGTLRSGHPQVSFCANGSLAENLAADHPLTPQFGMASPLGKLYELPNAKVLLLGAGYDACTSFHLAEALLEDMPSKKMGTAVMDAGARTWKWFEDFAYDSADFSLIGAELDERGELPVRDKVGMADSRLFNLRAGVDAAREWLKTNRNNG